MHLCRGYETVDYQCKALKILMAV